MQLTKRISLLLAVSATLACGGKKNTVPTIDWHTQFEMRTLEARYSPLQEQMRSLERDMNTKLQKMQQACGSGYEVAVNEQTTEYFCKAAPAPTPAKAPAANTKK